jgi:hypothetical protein
MQSQQMRGQLRGRLSLTEVPSPQRQAAGATSSEFSIVANR